MPRTQTVHLFQAYHDVGTETFCEEVGLPGTAFIEETTCEECLKAAANFGRRALVRGFELGLFEVKTAP